MGQSVLDYVIPEHHMYLSDDRTELVFEQRLPLVRKEDVNIEVLEKSICLDFRVEGRRMARCYSLPYDVDPATAEGSLHNEVLTVRARLRTAPFPGKKLML
jgi:HSP20 family molecular chaperone IbpA